MQRVDQDFGRLYGGVSKQDPGMRFPTQSEEVTNLDVSILRGLTRRNSLVSLTSAPQSVYDSSDPAVAQEDQYTHFIDRDVNEKYVVRFTGDGTGTPIKVWDINGTSIPVVYNNSSNLYLSSSNPRADIRAATAADYTVIVNRTVAPTMASVTPTNPDPVGYVWVNNTAANIKFSVYLTPLGSSPINTEDKATDTHAASDNSYKIATGLKNAINSLSSTWGTTPFTATLYGDDDSANIFKITCEQSSSAIDFLLKASDGVGGSYIKFAKDEVEKKEDLPPEADDGDRLKITNNASPGSSPYYMEFDSATQLWRETTKIDIENSFNGATMPVKMVRLQDDVSGTVTGTPNQVYFEVDLIDWDDRLVGDYETTPRPSFIDNGVIDDVAFYKNRLVLLSKDSVCLSRANDVFNFWPQTVIEVLDDDPIDISVGGTQVPRLMYAVPTAGALMLIGENQQFALTSGNDVLRATNPTVDLVSQLDIQPNCRPAVMGQSLFMVSPTGSGSSSLMEYFIDPDAVSTRVDDASEHVLGYLPDDMAYLTASPSDGTLYMCTYDGEVYVYRTRARGEEKIQSAFSKWNSRFLIWAILSVNDKLYFVTSPDASASTYAKYDMRLMVSNKSHDWLALSGCPIPVYLDGVIDNPTLTDSVFTYPGDLNLVDLANLVVVYKPTGQLVQADIIGTPNGESILDPVEDTLDTHPGLTTLPSEDNTDYAFGWLYDSSVTITEWRRRDPRTEAPVNDNTLAHSHVLVEVDTTPALTVTHTPSGRSAMSYTYPLGTDLDDADLPATASGVRQFRVRGQARGMVITIASRLHLALNITSYTLRGTYRDKGGNRLG